MENYSFLVDYQLQTLTVLSEKEKICVMDNIYQHLDNREFAVGRLTKGL